MQYIDAGSSLAQKGFQRKATKKTSLFYQQSVKEQDEFSLRYERNTNELQIFRDDPSLKQFQQHFEIRNSRFFELLEQILKHEKNLADFATGYTKYGFIVSDTGITYREWAPGAKEVYLFGDFNGWNRKQFYLLKDKFGNWEIFFPRNEDGTYMIDHNSRVKVHILNDKDQWVDRIPSWATFTYQDSVTKAFDGVFWNPEAKFEFKNQRPPKPRAMKIYEVHIGMAGIEERVHTFKEFTLEILPRIVKLGYNTIQIMAIQEHAYYGSFGYHVTNFFSVSSRFGTPEDLKELIDTAHGLGIFVLMDLVHSHASSNEQDGIGNWDGTGFQYFHAGEKGNHPSWDSKLFDYGIRKLQIIYFVGKWEVLRFLLSNLAWWMKEYMFDGFRFDGVTSMLYCHHGVGFGFSGGLHEYFNEAADIEAIVYLMLANDLIHYIYKDAVTIAEDVSGYPTLCRSIRDGGIGFDYRMAMAVPDKWIKLLKEQKDEDWNIEDITNTLTNRRYLENCIAYTECHDQALVGDKTLAMWLFDKEIYENMSLNQHETIKVARGMALHKMLRLVTIALGGEGYLTFMGNEFGHPEWIDFPRDGNNWSYHYATRRWDLSTNKELRFSYLQEFDIKMLQLEENAKWLPNGEQYVSLKHEVDKILAFERGNLLFVFNFHSQKSFENYRIGTKWNVSHKLVFDTDHNQFGGHGRVNKGYDKEYPVFNEPWCGRNNYLQVYLPSRCAIVLKPMLE